MKTTNTQTDLSRTALVLHGKDRMYGVDHSIQPLGHKPVGVREKAVMEVELTI